MSPLSKRDFTGALKTIGFAGGAFALYLLLSWLWERHGAQAIGSAMGPTLHRIVAAIAGLGSRILLGIKDSFFDFVFLPVVNGLGYVWPGLAKVLSENHFLFVPLLIVLVVAILLIVGGVKRLLLRLSGQKRSH